MVTRHERSRSLRRKGARDAQILSHKSAVRTVMVVGYVFRHIRWAIVAGLVAVPAYHRYETLPVRFQCDFADQLAKDRARTCPGPFPRADASSRDRVR